MKKKLQDLAWACLPKEARDEARRIYHYKCSVKDYDEGANDTLESLFSFHNLTSDTEPEEMLVLPRIDAIEEYKQATADLARTGDLKYRGKRELLKSFFGDKCLPDEKLTKSKQEMETEIKESTTQVKPKPRFKVGDKVRVIEDGIYKGFITEVISIDESDEDYPYQIDSYRAFEEGRWFSDSDLAPTPSLKAVCRKVNPPKKRGIMKRNRQ